MKRAAFVLALVACRAETAHVVVLSAPKETAQPEPIALPAPRKPLFPEDPSLDATEPADVLFHQETWTGASEWQQHCREWGVDPARADEVRDRINAQLVTRGIHMPEQPSAKGIVVAIGNYAIGVVDHGPRTRVAVCTEGVAPKSEHEAFIARVLMGPRLPSADVASLGAPDVVWRRVHSTGEIEIGLRYPRVPEADSKRVVDAVAAAHDAHFKVKLRGTDLWWTALEKP